MPPVSVDGVEWSETTTNAKFLVQARASEFARLEGFFFRVSAVGGGVEGEQLGEEVNLRKGSTGK